MAECRECGTATVPGEAFCSNCGTKNPVLFNQSEAQSSDRGDDSKESGAAAKMSPEQDALSLNEAGNEAEDKSASSGDELMSSDSLGGSTTGEVPVEVRHTIKKGNTGGHQPTVKQLDPGSVLNIRYEIVRRIGGGGMGAVYLAKDRNLGDAPRAVKEMVEAHLDPAQHEKAIGDFKRESLLLTALEHPSIPTIYDYFYDDSLSRFYLVMKYISGGDVASRMSGAGVGRVDAYTDTGWGREVADALASEHWRA